MKTLSNECDDTDIEGARIEFDHVMERRNRKWQFGFLPVVPPPPVDPGDKDGAYDRYISSRLAVAHIRLVRFYYIEQFWIAGILIGGISLAAWMPFPFMRVIVALLLGGAAGRCWGLRVAIKELNEGRCCCGNKWTAPEVE